MANLLPLLRNALKARARSVPRFHRIAKDQLNELVLQPSIIARALSVPSTSPSTARAVQSQDPWARHPSYAIELADGRRLGYTVCGDSSSSRRHDLVYLHGQGGTRLEAHDLHDDAKSLGIRVIGLDRPGLGLSSIQRKRKLLDWPSDLQTLTEHLGLESYHLAGASGGGPHVLACAKVLPPATLKSVNAIAGWGPWTDGIDLTGVRTGTLWAMRATEWCPGFTSKAMYYSSYRSLTHKDPSKLEKACKRYFKYDRSADRELFQKDDFARAFAQGVYETFKQGPKGIEEDSKMMVKDWGFKLEDISHPNIKLYYGSMDGNTPPTMGKAMAARLAGSVYKEYPGCTHLSLLEEHGADLLADLVA